MSYRVFLQYLTWGVLSCVCGKLAAAELTYEDPAALYAGAQQYLQMQLVARYGEAKVKADVEFRLLPPDLRLRLSKCEQPVNHTISSNNLAAGQVSLKVSCGGTNPWSLYLPAQITQYGAVAVATRSLARGDILQASDIQFERHNLSQIGPNYVDAANRVLGFELKRPLREGEPLRLSFVEAPKIIQRGDQVVLEAAAQGLSVVAPGTAMANGQMGENIRVRNTSSDKIVDALVIAPGRVRVRY